MFNYYKKLYVYATSNSLLVQGMKAFRTSCHTKGAIMSLLDIFAFVLDIVFLGINQEINIASMIKNLINI